MFATPELDPGRASEWSRTAEVVLIATEDEKLMTWLPGSVTVTPFRIDLGTGANVVGRVGLAIGLGG